MKKMERLVGIIYALKENKKLTAKEISNIFEVSERTIYRDIDALSQLEVPIKAFEGFGGGYEIDESYFVPSLTFIKNEVIYLLICLKIGEIVKVPNMKADYESLKYKLLNILNDDDKEKYMKILKRIRFFINRMVLSDYQEDITKKIIKSFLECKDLVLKYYNPKKDECIERRITPCELSYFSGGWYINGYCHLRKAQRLFRLDRIKSIKISEDAYSPDIIDEYINEVERKEEGVTVILEMDKRLYETVKNDNVFVDAEAKVCGDIVELKFYTDTIDNIIDLAFRNHEEVNIIEPKEYVDRLKQICKYILDKY